ncbi:phage tail tube protein [Nitrosospira sp. Nsp1]|uniref:phage tail tube protein n=1 Tax=Nitrosospira sp. Nsp1 TaxID=136547 RepID=UPI0008887B91|nr:phage tail tube protein [Nitrosospira sp. Nsp1]SCX40441.1 hypothetical protein SAMN05720354_103110 [Nitrosospira sp. Nsp1]
MARYARNSIILAKIETTPGVDAVPTGAANAILVSNLSINPLNANNVPRDLIRPYFGGSEQLVGSASVEVQFDVEISGSGTAGTAPAWGPLLRASAFLETETAAARVEYTPITVNQESLTVYYHDDGVLHKLLMAKGDFTMKMGIGERPVFSFKFTGLDGGVTAVSNPSPTLTPFKKPLVITDPNTGDILLGCTYATGALTGGSSFPSRGLEITMGNAVVYTPLLGGESIDITNREPSGKAQFDLSAAEEVTFMGDIKTNNTQSIGFIHGTTAGNKILVHAPVCQLINPSKQELNGRRLFGCDLRIMPSAGNDDLRIVTF